jgi:ATP synthase I chain
MTARADLKDPPEQVRNEQFFAGAISRILKFTLVIAALLLLLTLWRFGVAAALGFAVGAAISWVNFQSLRRSVEALADRVVDQHSTQRGSVVVLRFVLRYLLVAACAYAIFKGSRQAFEGFLFGVCLPVAAMLVEAAYETYMVFRRGY